MALPSILTGFSHDAFVWLAMTIILGGAAAVATGRALAQSWRGLGLALFYAALLAAAVDFLCYALFQVSAIPMLALADAVIAQDYAALAMHCTVWAATFVVLAVFVIIGWRLTRSRMMAAQYGFLTGRSSP